MVLAKNRENHYFLCSVRVALSLSALSPDICSGDEASCIGVGRSVSAKLKISVETRKIAFRGVKVA